MQISQQLEIIHPDGKVVFYDLDPHRGVVNIGRDPDNDIVIDSPVIAPFHVVLDYRKRPCYVVKLSTEENVAIDGQATPYNAPTPLPGWTPLEIADTTFILLEENGEVEPHRATAETQAAAETQTSVSGIKGLWQSLGKMMPGAKKFTPPRQMDQLSKVDFGLSDDETQQPAGGANDARPVAPDRARSANPPPDQHDDVIVTELTEREWSVDVEEAASTRLTIANGGDIVATFNIHVEGVNESWIDLSTPQVNLNEGERAGATIAITPPRSPSSRAGVYPITIVVTSPNHPERASRMGALLTINPYYEFSIGELSPKQQTVSWSKQTGRVTLPITNRGNSHALFRIEAHDDEQACSFEIDVPGESTSLVRQAEMRLPPARPIAVPISITPISRQLAAMSPHFYAFNVTASLLEGDENSRAVMGQLWSKPLIGPLRMLFLILLLAISVVLIFQPRIHYFRIEPQTGIIRAGDTVRLQWRVSAFATDLEIDGYDGQIEGPSGTVTHTPSENVATYQLKADNWLSRLLPQWLSKSRSQTVIVIPRDPRIETFAASKKEIVKGERITLHWSVSGADQVVFTANSVAEVIPPDEYIGQRELTPESNAIYILEASNASGIDLQSMMVRVIPPTLVIERFDVQPTRIAPGETVSLTWSVLGATSVKIAPLGDEYPPQGSTIYAPEKTMDLILSAAKGEAEVRTLQNVIVESTPGASGEVEDEDEESRLEIEYFTVTPREMVKDENNETRLAWSIAGETSSIEITSPDHETLSNLAAQGDVTIAVNQSTTFTLIARNGEQRVSRSVEVTVQEPTSTLTATPTLTPTLETTPEATPSNGDGDGG